MKARAFVPLFLGLVLTATILIQIQEPILNNQVPTVEVHEAAKLHLVEVYGELPLSFEANRGQTDPQVKFLSRGNGYNLYLTSSEAVLTLRNSVEYSKDSQTTGSTPTTPEGEEAQANSSAVIHMKLVGANPEAQAVGLDELAGKSNYFIGNDPEKWHTNVPNYAKVEYREVYPGVDLVYYGNQRQLEYDFIVAPGADLPPLNRSSW